MKKQMMLWALIATLLVSCGGNTEKQPDTTADTADAAAADTEAQTEPERVPDIPADVTFDGREVKILSGTYNIYGNLLREETNGEVLNDAICQMQADTEERLNVKQSEKNDVGTQESNNLAVQLIMAGDGTYDIMSQLDRFAIELMLSGHLQALDDVPYVDFSAPWWNPAITNRLSLGGTTYYAVSAANLLLAADTTVFYMNTTLAASHGIDKTALYDTVREGKWTTELFFRYIADTAADLNGDGTFGDTDLYGFMCYDPHLYGASMMAGSELWAVTKDADDRLGVSWDSEAYHDGMERFYNLYHQSDMFRMNPRGDTTIFTDGRSIFMHGFFIAADKLQDMEDDYAILPIPKASETQENYVCANYDVMMFVMPQFVSDPVLYGAVTEWLSYEGYSHVRDAYVETTLKYKKARDSETAEMVQLCLDSSQVDLGSIYAYKQCSYDAIFDNVMEKNTFVFASLVEKNEKALNTQLTKIMDAVDKQ